MSAAAESLSPDKESPPKQETEGAYSNALALYLNRLLHDFVQDREPQEIQYRDNYQDYMRIVRDDDTRGSGAPKARKARKLFVGLTRSKIRTARSRILDSLFGQAKMPFDISETHPSVSELADAFEDILTRQLQDMDYPTMMYKAVNGLCIYGTGYTCGPHVRQKTLTRVVNEANSGNIYALTEEKFTYDEPYFTYDRVVDVYPDHEATGSDTGRGVFVAKYKHPWEIEEWRDDPDYHFVEEAIAQKSPEWLKAHGSKLLQDLRANINFNRDDGRLAIIRFYGRVPASVMRTWPGTDNQTPDAEDDNDTVEILAIMVGQVVVWAVPTPWDSRGVYRCFYEDGDDEVDGVGIAENNAAAQRVVNAAFRLFMEAKGLALLGVWDIDPSKYAPGEDFRMYGGKVFKRAPGVTTEEAEKAMRQIKFDDVSEGWESAIERGLQFSDDETGIPKYTQGTDAQHLNKTATGVSLIMGSAAFPLKEVMSNIDRRWVDKHLAALIKWDLEHLDAEVVRRMFDDEMAVKWAAIKAWGRANFIEVRPTGTSSYVAREVLLQKLTQFLSLALTSPAALQLIDLRELLDQIWEAMEVGKESVVKDTKQIAAEQQQGAMSPLAMVQLQEALAGIGLDKAKTAQILASIDSTRGKLLLDANNQQHQQTLDRLGAIESAIKTMQPGAAPAGQPKKLQPMVRGKGKRR